MQLKALVTGANGMLGDALCPILEREGYILCRTDIMAQDGILKLDVRELSSIKDSVSNFKPDIVFHLAAETDVDKCELDKDHAYKTNSEGTKNVALVCKDYNIPMVYISTAAVFDGENENGYREDDMPGNCVNVYGKSKLEGEVVVCSLLKNYYIIRASWMIGGFNKDKKFVWKIVQLLKTRKEISVVTDKLGSPTFTKDFARGIVKIVSKCKPGIYHCVNKGRCTRFDIAKKIAEYLGKKDVILKPVTSDAFPLPAPRPRSEVLINHKLLQMGMDDSRRWEDALKEYLEAAVGQI